MVSLNEAIEKIYSTFDGPGAHQHYHERHGTASLNVLTVRDADEARTIVADFVDAVRGKTVVEIGAGVGLLAIELARHAKQVWAIESDPAWSWSFNKYLYASKPANLTWIFGSAESVADWLRADVAVIRTRSGAVKMVAVAERMADTIVLSASACGTSLVAPRGDETLRHISEYIDRRVAELLEESQAVVNNWQAFNGEMGKAVMRGSVHPKNA